MEVDMPLNKETETDLLSPVIFVSVLIFFSFMLYIYIYIYIHLCKI